MNIIEQNVMLQNDKRHNISRFLVDNPQISRENFRRHFFKKKEAWKKKKKKTFQMEKSRISNIIETQIQFLQVLEYWRLKHHKGSKFYFQTLQTLRKGA